LLALAGMIALFSGLQAVPHPAEIQRLFDAPDPSQNDAIGLADWELASSAFFKSADPDQNGVLETVEGAFLSPARQIEMEKSGGCRVTLESFIAGYVRFLKG
jgi:hypothetical protein